VAGDGCSATCQLEDDKSAGSLFTWNLSLLGFALLGLISFS
jgi:hypothetical protein